MRKFEHVTITTGATRQSARAEVDDRVVDKIRAALAGDGCLWAGWRVRFLASPAGAHIYDVEHNGQAIARCWLCEDAAASAGAWAAASASGLDPNVVLRQPARAPWLAVALTATGLAIAMAEPSVLLECGDVERCVAWAILE